MRRREFLALATLVQSGLILLALGLAWLLQIPLLASLDFSLRSLGLALLATIPMLVLFGATYCWPVGPLRTIKSFLIDQLGPSLAECRIVDLIWVAGLAGVSEELLFRAVLQEWLSQWGASVGWIISNVLFGMAHAVTAFYAILAAGLGLYLGALYESAAGGNVVVPAMTHALYDFLAFLVVRRTYQVRQRGISLTDDETAGPVTSEEPAGSD